MTPSEVRTFVDENPELYRAFEAEALRIIERGRKRYSARTIVEWLRHNSAVQADPTGEFKINDHVTPTLARDFLDDHPEAPPRFFETRGADVIPKREPFALTG